MQEACGVMVMGGAPPSNVNARERAAGRQTRGVIAGAPPSNVSVREGAGRWAWAHVPVPTGVCKMGQHLADARQGELEVRRALGLDDREQQVDLLEVAEPELGRAALRAGSTRLVLVSTRKPGLELI